MYQMPSQGEGRNGEKATRLLESLTFCKEILIKKKTLGAIIPWLFNEILLFIKL